MLKFEKHGKKLMEMDENGNMTFHDKEFENKMKLKEEKVKGKSNDKQE